MAREMAERSEADRLGLRRLQQLVPERRGENTNNWPGPWLEYRRRTRRINPGDYRVAV